MGIGDSPLKYDSKKAKKIFETIDKIYFLRATAELHALMIALFMGLILISAEIIKYPDSFSFTTVGFMIVVAILVIVCHKMARKVITKYFTGRKIEKACEEVISALRNDPEILEILYLVRMNGIPRDRVIGTIILQKYIKN